MPRTVDLKVRKVIARNLRRALADQPRGVVSVAEALKMPQSQFSGYLHAHRGFAIETLLRLAVTLDCSLDDLVRDVDKAYTEKAATRRWSDLEPEVAVVVDVLEALQPAQLDAVFGMARAFLSSEAPSGRTAEHSGGKQRGVRTSGETRQHRLK